MRIAAEFFAVCVKVLWTFAAAAARWLVTPQEKCVRGRVCVITGAGSGLGRMFALHFARRGATLVLWDINRATNEETAELVREIYQQNISSTCAGPGDSSKDSPEVQPRVFTYVCDVSKRERVYAAAGQVMKEVGDVTFLVNNAGVVSGRHLLECPDELIERTMMVNCHAHFWTTKAFLPKMLELNQGHIVTVASSLGLFTTPGVEDYCASKFGAVGFHEALSHELKATDKDGIKMTLVCPLLADTEMRKACVIRKQFAPFFPPLSPELCAARAMSAILTDQPVVCLPRSVYAVALMKSILPFDAVVRMYRSLGDDKSMYSFSAHQKESINNNGSRLST